MLEHGSSMRGSGSHPWPRVQNAPKAGLMNASNNCSTRRIHSSAYYLPHTMYWRYSTAGNLEHLSSPEIYARRAMQEAGTAGVLRLDSNSSRQHLQGPTESHI